LNLSQPASKRGSFSDPYRIKIITIGQILVPIFLLLNIVLTANEWDIGRVFYIFALLLCVYCSFRSKLLFPILICVSFIFVFRVLEVLQPNISMFRPILTSCLFILFGMVLYATNLVNITKVLVWFAVLSVPILISQILGLHEFLFYWGNDGLHDPNLMFTDEIGSFKSLPMYPTFMIRADDITYSIIQGRPSGLMANNNVSSVLVAFAFILNLYVRPRNSQYFSDAIISLAVVLIMSKYLFVVVLLSIILAMIGNHDRSRRVANKCAVYLFVWIIGYALIFPGLFSINFGSASITYSFWARFIDIFNIIGTESSLMLSSEVIQQYGLELDGNGYLDSHPLLRLLSTAYFTFGLSLLLVLFYFFGFKKHMDVLKASNLSDYYLKRMLLLASVLAIPVMPNFVIMSIYMLLCGIIFTSDRRAFTR